MGLCDMNAGKREMEIDMKLDATTSLNDLALSPNAELKENRGSFCRDVYKITNALAEMLINKNAEYGNSALEPKRIFSKADTIEQLKVRADDKLARLANQNVEDDEDVLLDLQGYLILLTIALKK